MRPYLLNHSNLTAHNSCLEYAASDSHEIVKRLPAFPERTQSRISARGLPPEILYISHRTIQLSYGPKFRTVRAAYGSSAGLGVLDLCSASDSWEHMFETNPALLDGLFQTALITAV
jgi:hypothetical protein